MFGASGRTYSISDTIVIECAAVDALSDIAAATCPDLKVGAWTLGTGTHSLTAIVTDVAGNTTVEAISFTVTVDADSLGELVAEMVGTGGP